MQHLLGHDALHHATNWRGGGAMRDVVAQEDRHSPPNGEHADLVASLSGTQGADQCPDQVDGCALGLVA